MSCQWFTASNTVETIHRRSLSETIQWTLTMNEYLAVPLASLQLLQQYLMFTLCLSRYFYVCKSSGLQITLWVVFGLHVSFKWLSICCWWYLLLTYGRSDDGNGHLTVAIIGWSCFKWKPVRSLMLILFFFFSHAGLLIVRHENVQ